jgi:GT2 family glycosyltransferase
VVADYYILLNSDIEVTENWIMPVINLMEENSDIAACQPKILAYEDKERFEYAGAAGGFIDHYGYPFCRGRIFMDIEKDYNQYDESLEVFWATGACLFIKAELFHAAGGFDEDFFAHMEEIDLCWRLKRMGYAIYYCAGAKVYHVGGGTLPKRSAKKTYLNFRNNLMLLYKNLPKKRIYPVFFVRTILDGVAALKFLVSAGFADFVAVFKAHLHFYKNLKREKAKRKTLTTYSVSGIYRDNLVILHYLKGVKTFSQLKRSKFTSKDS